MPIENYKAYIIINTDINMSVGKCFVQIARAGIYLERYLSKNFGKEFFRKEKWQDNFETLIFLQSNSNTINKLKIEYKNHLSVIDVGKNEVLPNTETCIIIPPINELEITKTLKRCQTYKLNK